MRLLYLYLVLFLCSEQWAIAKESFNDLLKLREVGTNESIPALEMVLADHFGSTRIYEFAAAQAMFCIDTPEAHKVLQKYVLSTQYNVQLSMMYAYGWEMNEQQRSRFILGYHLQNLSKDIEIVVEECNDLTMFDSTRELCYLVTLRNISRKPYQLFTKPYWGELLVFVSEDGRVASPHELYHYTTPQPELLELAPGEKSIHTITLHTVKNGIKPCPKGFSLQPIIDLRASNVVYDIRRPGKYYVYALLYKPQMKFQKSIKNYWSGRAVSKPLLVEIADKSQSQHRDPIDAGARRD